MEKLKYSIAALLVGFNMSGSRVCASPQLNSDTILSNAGYFQLRWSDETSRSFRLQQSSSADFNQTVTLYQGPDKATVISGLPNGMYFYRVANDQQQWSNSIIVTVKHHSLAKALSFFAVGAIMFIVMVTLLIRGTKRKDHA